MSWPASPTRRHLLLGLSAAGLWPGLALPVARADNGPWRWPAPGRWRYQVDGRVRGLPYRASARLDWQHDERQYLAELSMSMWLLGERRQRSQGELGPEGLRPVQFLDSSRRTREWRMDWPQARFQAPERDEPLPLPRGAQDRLSLFFQLGGLLSRWPSPPPAGHRWLLPVLGRRGSEDWTFVAAGNETLSLPVGEVATWKVERPPHSAQDLRSELWFAPAWQQLPVRIRLTEANGDVVDQRLEQRLPPP